MSANNEKLKLANGYLSILTFLSGRKEIQRCFGVVEAVSCAYSMGL
jgi:HrpA-like RNA helicase